MLNHRQVQAGRSCGSKYRCAWNCRQGVGSMRWRRRIVAAGRRAMAADAVVALRVRESTAAWDDPAVADDRAASSPPSWGNPVRHPPLTAIEFSAKLRPWLSLCRRFIRLLTIVPV